MTADPVSLFDEAPTGDGAAAVLVTTSERAADMVARPVRILASALATDTVALHDRRDLLWLAAAERSARRAYEMAGLSPTDIDVAELHDSFTILAALSLEACGFAERGQGWQLARDGEIGRGGRIPISTFGGLKARGNPPGATGLYQIVEVAQQLRGRRLPGGRCARGLGPKPRRHGRHGRHPHPASRFVRRRSSTDDIEAAGARLLSPWRNWFTRSCTCGIC